MYQSAAEVGPFPLDVAVLRPLHRTRIVGAKVTRVTRQVERMITCPACKGSSYPDADEPYLCGECGGAGVLALCETVIEVEPLKPASDT